MKTLLDALEQACREEVGGSGIRPYVTTDRGAAAHMGALTPRIAFILQWPAARVRRHLHALEQGGQVIKHRPYPCTIRWWPVGFLERFRAEREST
jgi:hypothetical protein